MGELELNNKKLLQVFNLDSNIHELLKIEINFLDITKLFEGYTEELYDTKEKLDKLTFGWLSEKNHIELFSDGLDIYKSAIADYENKRKSILNFYNQVNSFKQYFAIDIINFIQEPIQKIVGFEKLKSKEFQILSEYSKLSNYSFHIDIDKFENKINYIETLKFNEFTGRILNNLENNIFNEENLEKLQNYNLEKRDEDTFEVTSSNKSSKILKQQIAFEVGKEVFNAVNERMKEVEHYKNEYKKIIQEYEKLKDRLLLMNNSLNIYMNSYKVITVLYQSYRQQKEKLLLQFDKLYSIEDFQIYGEIFDNFQEELNSNSKKLNLLLEKPPKKPNIIIGLFNFITHVKEEYQEKLLEYNNDISARQFSIDATKKNFRELNQYLKEFKRYKEYNNSIELIKDFAKFVKPIKESFNEELSLNQK